MPTALPLSGAVSQASQVSTKYQVLKTQYGNGYSQRAGDGINNVQDSWQVQWNGLTTANFQILKSAFDAAAGVDYFTWQAPGDTTTKKWIVSQVTRTNWSGAVYDIAVTLEQVFDL